MTDQTSKGLGTAKPVQESAVFSNQIGIRLGTDMETSACVDGLLGDRHRSVAFGIRKLKAEV